MLRVTLPIIVLIGALSACSDSVSLPPNASTANSGNEEASQISRPPEPIATADEAVDAPAPQSEAAPRSCSAEIGAAAAKRLVGICRNVSPATHPPCNATNSCAMIEDEIARSCALFAGNGSPVQGCSSDPKGMQAAADVVRRYYAAIDARDYATAWVQWGDDGRPGTTLKAFEDGYAHTRSTRVTIGTLMPGDGAAGSIYQPVPVTVDAALDDGRSQRFVGNYVIRRINDVDGATAAQLRWHIDSANLRPAPSN